MENKRFFAATDVQEMLGVSLSYAYKLIRKLNAETGNWKQKDEFYS